METLINGNTKVECVFVYMSMCALWALISMHRAVFNAQIEVVGQRTEDPLLV